MVTGDNRTYLQQTKFHTVAPYRAALLTYPANLRQALKDAQTDPAKTMFGVGQGLGSVALTKVFASTKPDFIWLDVEHGMYNRQELYDAIQAANHHSEGKSAVIVRVPKGDEISLTTSLDAGAAGLVIPHTESAQEVKNLIKEAYYPPIGQRSFSPWTFTPGVSDDSLYEGDPFNMATSNRHIALIPQIESVKGIENIDEIASVEGVAGLMFGPGDFMADAGIPLALGGVPDPRLLDAMGKLAAAAAKYKIPLLAGALDMAQVPQMLQSGFGVIVIFMDVWGIAKAVSANLEISRQHATEFAAKIKEAKDNNTSEVTENTKS